MGIFDNATSININNKDVKMLKIDDRIVYHRVDGIELSSNKSVLSYVDSDTATLSAQLVDCEDNPMGVSGELVTFEICERNHSPSQVTYSSDESYIQLSGEITSITFNGDNSIRFDDGDGGLELSISCSDEEITVMGYTTGISFTTTFEGDSIDLNSIREYMYSEYQRSTFDSFNHIQDVIIAEGSVTVTYDEGLLCTMIGVTNQNGLATATYNSANAGDITFYAKTNNINSNNINIKDILYYDPSSSANVSKYTPQSSKLSITYNSTEQAYILNNSSKDHHYYTINNVAIQNNAIIECDVKMPNEGNSQTGLGIGNIRWRIIHATNELVYTLRISKTNTILSETDYITDNDWYHMKVELNNGIGTLTLSREGTTLKTISYDVSSEISGNDVKLFVGYDTNRYIRFKNISVKTN